MASKIKERRAIAAEVSVDERLEALESAVAELIAEAKRGRPQWANCPEFDAMHARLNRIRGGGPS